MNKLESACHVPRDDGEHHAVHRPLRHGVGHHGGVPGDRRRPARRTSASWRPASPKRSSRRPRACSPRSRRCYFYNHLVEPREAARLRDGRLLARVPEHLGAQFHLTSGVAHAQTPVARSRASAAGAAARAAFRPALAEINVVPLVDVMLVLLIIFMVTAPMMQRGLDVNLPVARRAQQISRRAHLRQRARSPIGQRGSSISARSRCAWTFSTSGSGRRC